MSPKEENRLILKKALARNQKAVAGDYTRMRNPRMLSALNFATPTDARKTVAKVKKISKPYARKIQILTVGEQRAKVVVGKDEWQAYLKKAKETLKKQKEKKWQKKQLKHQKVSTG